MGGHTSHHFADFAGRPVFNRISAVPWGRVETYWFCVSHYNVCKHRPDRSSLLDAADSQPKRMLLLFVGTHRILWSATGLIPFLFPKEWWVGIYIGVYTVAFIANTIGGMIWTSLIGDIVPAKVRGRYFGIRNTILNALGSVCLFVGGIILDRFPGEMGFLILFIPVWICAIANTVIYFFYPDLPFERSTEKVFWPMFKKPFEDRAFLKATLFLASGY